MRRLVLEMCPELGPSGFERGMSIKLIIAAYCVLVALMFTAAIVVVGVHDMPRRSLRRSITRTSPRPEKELWTSRNGGAPRAFCAGARGSRETIARVNAQIRRCSRRRPPGSVSIFVRPPDVPVCVGCR